jgi:putative tricarboxylic transport membrane protein
MVTRRRLLGSWAITVALAAIATAAPAMEQLRLIAPAAPGGGWDQTARVMQQTLQRAGIVRIAPVENIPGAAGTIGLARFVGAERGTGDVLMVSGLIMLGGIVMHRSPVTLHDVVPIARLTGEYEVIAVPVASPFRSLADLVAALKQKPEAISWGGGSAGGSDQMLAGLIADALGIDPSRINYIAFSGGGESLSAVLGGQVSVGINGLAELEPQIAAGTLRALAISSSERLSGLNVPTLREQGVDVQFENWRSLVAPPGISTSDRRRLETTVDAMVQSAEWREALQRYRWIDRYLTGPQLAAFVDAEEQRARDILRKLGARERETNGVTDTGPYPLLVLGGLLLFACAAVFEARRQHANAGVAPVLRARAPMALLAAGVVLHLLLAERAGFVIATAVLFWFTARAFDERHPLRDAIVALAVSTSAYLLFVRVLQLSLPAGLLARWL